MKPVIIGVGNRWRGDDGVGPRAIDAIDELGRDDVDVLVLDGEPARLAAAWVGRPCAVVVDAIRADAAPGTIHHLADPDRMASVISAASTHGGGVAVAVALARALGTLPGRLVVLGIEPAGVGHGDRLSPEVARALPDVVTLAVAEVSGACV
jgi:hydrogenase maturation protease